METIYHERTRRAFLWSRLLKAPFWAIYNLLPFILYQEMKAVTDHPPIQIALMIAMKPMVAILSLYWSAEISMRRDRLVANIVWGGVLAVLPFLFFPFFENSWIFVGSFVLYMLLHRGTMPAWMEVIRLNIPGISGKKVFAYGSSIGYIGDALFPFLFGPLLDGYFESWRWIFACTAFLSLISIFFQCRIPIKIDESIKETFPKESSRSLVDFFVKPWKEVWNLILARRDFRNFQLGFMAGGAGLMIMQAVLPAYFKGVLHLSWTELAVALTCCKGIGFALTSQSWANWMHRVNIYKSSGFVTLIASVFPLFLLAGSVQLIWIYVAYIIYGIMQAGSELTWNLSGPIFSKEEDSSIYSSVNVATVGIRGCVAPFFGTWLLYGSSPEVVILVGGFFCLLATFVMGYNGKVKKSIEY